MTRARGFTLVEVIITLSLIGLIASFSLPFYASFSRSNDFDVAVMTLAHALRRASFLARASDGEDSWGVALGEGHITLFKGASFETREEEYDERFELSAAVVHSGDSEVVFEKFSSFPLSSASFTLSTDDAEVIMSVNEKGTVTY